MTTAPEKLMQDGSWLMERLTRQDRQPEGLASYLVWDRALDPADSPAAAWQGPFLDLSYREQIGDAWTGRGVCVGIGARGICDRVDQARGTFSETAAWRDRTVWIYFLGALLHELGHALSQELNRKPALSNQRYAELSKLYLKARRETGYEPDGPKAAVPFAGHDASFIRAVIHIQHRALRYAARCHLGIIVDSRFYGLSPIEQYAECLGTEPAALDAESFSTIRRIPAPLPFRQLWRDDVTRYFDSLPLEVRGELCREEITYLRQSMP